MAKLWQGFFYLERVEVRVMFSKVKLGLRLVKPCVALCSNGEVRCCVVRYGIGKVCRSLVK